MVWAARRAAVRLRFAEATVVAGEAVDGWAAASGCGNPDLVPAEAVTAGVSRAPPGPLPHANSPLEFRLRCQEPR